MQYRNYQYARDAAWQALIRHGVSSLPVKISAMCKADGITVLPYAKAEPLITLAGLGGDMGDNDGFSTIIRASGGEKPCIFFDNLTCSVQRQRFTVGHEYGHFYVGTLWKVKPPGETGSRRTTTIRLKQWPILPRPVSWRRPVSYGRCKYTTPKP